MPMSAVGAYLTLADFSMHRLRARPALNCLGQPYVAIGPTLNCNDSLT